MKLHFDGKLKWTKFVADLIILFFVAIGLGLNFFQVSQLVLHRAD